MLSLLAAAAIFDLKSDFMIHNGDRILFYGDSITDNQYYPQFVEQYILTRFPKMRVSFLNYGWSGDRVTGGGGGNIQLRLSRDVFPNKPTVVTIMLGMNDGSYKAWDEGIFHTFADGYESLARAIASTTKARLTFIQPSPYDDVTMPPNFEGGYNGVLTRYGAYLAEFAPQFKATVADFNSPVVAMLRQASVADKEGARKLIPDRVHPTAAAHIVMGAALLKAWKAPALVSATTIDGSSRKGSILNGQLRDIKNQRGVLSWRTLENSLPVYFWRDNAAVALVLKSSDVETELNNETLTVKNLVAGDYQLSIDGETVGTFGTNVLEKGLDLTKLDTPMMRQSATIFALTEKRQSLRWTMWRSLVVNLDGYNLDQRKAAISNMNRLEKEIIDKQHEQAEPKWHSFSLKLVGSEG